MKSYLIVGAGLFGSVFAREMTDRGHKCVVIDKRNHIGGNCYSEAIDGIECHKYGPHVFHTNDPLLWSYINQFSSFNNYRLRMYHLFKNEMFSFPINLLTFRQFWGITTPDAAKEKLRQVRIPCDNPSNLEEWCLDKTGRELYGMFIKGYTTKQWGKPPSELPVEIIKRIPVRFNYDDNYFFDTCQGVPTMGYGWIFKNLLKGIDVRLNTDYFENPILYGNFDRILFTGKIDEFYYYKFGKLEYRDLQFETMTLDTEDFLGSAIVGFSDMAVPYTRMIEHKHFSLGKQPHTVITTEFPSNKGVPSYPIPTQKNKDIYSVYKNIPNDKVIFGGRLGSYQYLNMDATIKQALELVKHENTCS
jgi:UDP-galactopyranose mutase